MKQVKWVLGKISDFVNNSNNCLYYIQQNATMWSNLPLYRQIILPNIQVYQSKDIMNYKDSRKSNNIKELHEELIVTPIST